MLTEFRSSLEQLRIDPYSRPFVCSGSPLNSRVFIVGFNAATRLRRPFSEYWSDEFGFDKKKFMDDYFTQRGRLVGARARIQRIAEESGPEITLETNIFSEPTAKAADLRIEKKVSAIFEFLMFKVRPEIVYLHSNKPIEFFEKRVHCLHFQGIEKSPQEAKWDGLHFQLFATSGPLWRMSFDRATQVGRKLAAARGNSRLEL